MEILQANQTQVRTWTSSTGNQRLRAELRSVSEDGKQITLWFQDTDEENTVMLARFSQKDQDFVTQFSIAHGIEIQKKEIRTWTIEQHQVKAELIKISRDGKAVILQQIDSTKKEYILFEKLSDEDIKFVTQYKERKDQEKKEHWEKIIVQKEEHERHKVDQDVAIERIFKVGQNQVNDIKINLTEARKKHEAWARDNGKIRRCPNSPQCLYGVVVCRRCNGFRRHEGSLCSRCGGHGREQCWLCEGTGQVLVSCSPDCECKD